MDIATSFLPLLQPFAGPMTRPTFDTLTTLLAGWILAPRRTIAGMIRAADADRHHAAFHRVFASAAWSIDRVGPAVFDLVTAGMDTAFLAADDTLLPRRGLKVFGTGMHRDPLLSSRGHTAFAWGHCWIVLGVVLESRHVPGKRFTLPVLCRLYLGKASAAKWDRAYRKKTELMLRMLTRLGRHTGRSGKPLHLLGDSAYTAPAILAQIPDSIAVTGRVGSNVRLHEPVPPRRPGRNGRPRVRGRAAADAGADVGGQRPVAADAVALRRSDVPGAAGRANRPVLQIPETPREGGGDPAPARRSGHGGVLPRPGGRRSGHRRAGRRRSDPAVVFVAVVDRSHLPRRQAALGGLRAAEPDDEGGPTDGGDPAF